MGIANLHPGELRKLFHALEAQHVEYVVVGAIAMALHGITRATEDVDLFVLPTEGNIRSLRAALRTVWQDSSIEEIRAEDLSGEIGVVSYMPPEGEWHLDVISHLGEAFRYADIESMRIELGEGLEVSVATPRMLHRMKRDTLRPKDRLDAAWLRERFGLEDA